MKRTTIYLLALAALACCAFLPSLDARGRINEGYDPDAIHKPANLSDIPNVSTARTNLDVYSKEETDSLAAQSTLRYYLQEMSSGLATDGKDIELAATAPVSLASESATLSTSQAILDQWITATNTPRITTLVTGVYEIIGYFSKTGIPTVTLTYELWVVRSDGSAGEFIASSSAAILPTGTLTQERVTANITVSTAVTILNTDRLLLKLYGLKSTTQATTFYIWYGGAYSSYFGVPISPRNFLRTDGSNGAAIVALPGELQVTGNISGADISGTHLSTVGAIEASGTISTDGTMECNDLDVTNGITASGVVWADDAGILGDLGVVGDVGITGICSAAARVHSNTLLTCSGTTVLDGAVTAGGNLTAGTATVTGGLAVDTSTLYVDAGNNRAGVGTTTPQAELHVIGSGLFSGSNIYFATTGSVNPKTSDGADTGVAYLSGGGDSGRTRGAYIAAYGNENTTASGGLDLFGGYDPDGGNIRFLTGNGTERMRIASDGAVILASSTAGIPQAIEGSMYYNKSTHKLMVYDGTTWQACW